MAKAWEELGPQLWAFFHNSVQINMIRVKPAEVSFHCRDDVCCLLCSTYTGTILTMSLPLRSFLNSRLTFRTP